MAVHLIVRIALPSTAEKIFLAVSAITRDWTIHPQARSAAWRRQACSYCCSQARW